MERSSIAVIIAACLLVASATRADDTYKIDPVHTTVAFAVDHLVINKVHGRFKEFDGTLVLDFKADIALKSVAGTIKTASVDTGVEARDKHLRSADFFDVEKFPEIKFECARVRKDGERMVALGKFTMHGVTRALRLPFTLKGPIKDPMGKTRIAVEAHTTINRLDYGLAYNKVLETGGLAVGNEIAIEINAEAVKEEKAK